LDGGDEVADVPRCLVNRSLLRVAHPMLDLGEGLFGGLRSRAYADFPGRAALRPPCVFEGPINGQCFRAYVEQLLVPVLKPGDIVVMDNLGSHKSATIRQMIQAVGARLWYLPPYSPDLNPPNRPSPRSSIGCATRRSERLTRHRGTSATSSPPSNLANAQTTL
jgi:hypothetical protein